jgi:hypothetical protein
VEYSAVGDLKMGRLGYKYLRHKGDDGMTRVLLIGIKPEAVDVSDPDLPPGTTTEKIAAGII